MKIAPSVATVPIGTSFEHGDVSSRPSSSAHASSVALARHKNPSAGGETEAAKNAPGGAQTKSRTRASEDSTDQVSGLNFELVFLLGRGVTYRDQYLIEGLRSCLCRRLGLR